MEIPQYKHDCNKCIFLNRDVKGITPVDVYFCPQHGLSTIIMRYGDKGEDYLSIPINIINSPTFNDDFVIKYISIAEDKNLWSRDEI